MFLLHNITIFPQSQTPVANTDYMKQEKASPWEEFFMFFFDRKIHLWLSKAAPIHFCISK